MSPEHMLVQIRHAVIPHRHLRQEWQCPGKAGSKEDVIHASLECAIFEMHGPVFSCDVRDRRPSLDLWVLERLVAEIDIVATTDGRVDW